MLGLLIVLFGFGYCRIGKHGRVSLSSTHQLSQV